MWCLRRWGWRWLGYSFIDVAFIVISCKACMPAPHTHYRGDRSVEAASNISSDLIASLKVKASFQCTLSCLLRALRNRRHRDIRDIYGCTVCWKVNHIEHQSLNPSEGGVFVFPSSLSSLGTTGGVDDIRTFWVSLRLAVHPWLSRWVKRSHGDKAVRAVIPVGRHRYFGLDSAAFETVFYVNIRIQCGSSWLYLKPEREKKRSVINKWTTKRNKVKVRRVRWKWAVEVKAQPRELPEEFPDMNFSFSLDVRSFLAYHNALWLHFFFPQ